MEATVCEDCMGRMDVLIKWTLPKKILVEVKYQVSSTRMKHQTNVIPY